MKDGITREKNVLLQKRMQKKQIILVKLFNFITLSLLPFFCFFLFVNWNWLDVGSGNPLIKTKEASYFFKLSKYQNKLITHIKNTKNFIQPEKRRIEILKRLKEPLLDLSVSRTAFTWGIPVPDSENHILYVWCVDFG